MDSDIIVERYFAAMRRGSGAETELLELFDPEAVYTEPFTSDEPAIGLEAIRARFRQGWKQPLPELELDVLTLEVDGARAVSTWECRSPALPGPVRGEDRYEFRDGRIARLDVRMTEPR